MIERVVMSALCEKQSPKADIFDLVGHQKRTSLTRSFFEHRAPHSVRERRFPPSDNPLCPRSQLFACSRSIVPSGGKGHLEMTMAALLIGYAVAIAIVFFASRPIDHEANWGGKGTSRSTGETDAFSHRLIEANRLGNVG